MAKSKKNNKKRGKRPKPAAPPPERKWGPSDTLILLVALLGGMAVGVGIWYAASRQSESPGVALENESASGSPNPQQSSPPLESSPDLPKLKGKWIRSDGGYVIDIKSIAADGKLDVAYLNPKPVRVAQAQASRAGDTIKVFIELRDVNYPGSTYNLTYDAGKDELAGLYFQAAQGQRFDVTFMRVK